MNIDSVTYLTQREAAKYLGLSWFTIRAYCYGGRIKSTKILDRVLISKEELDRFKAGKAAE
jgi:excisionase family DNA binding protein